MALVYVPQHRDHHRERYRDSGFRPRNLYRNLGRLGLRVKSEVQLILCIHGRSALIHNGRKRLPSWIRKSANSFEWPAAMFHWSGEFTQPGTQRCPEQIRSGYALELRDWGESQASRSPLAYQRRGLLRGLAEGATAGIVGLRF